jgi:hypothetical protein
LFSSIPYPFGVPVLGAPLFGTSGDKFGVQSVVGPNGLIIPVKQSQPIGTDGKPLNSGIIMPFGGPMMGPMVGRHMMGPMRGPIIGNPMFGVPGMMGLRISRRDGTDGTKNQSELLRANINDIRDYSDKVTRMYNRLIILYETKVENVNILNKIKEFKNSFDKIDTLEQTAMRECGTKSDGGTCTEKTVIEAKAEHDRMEKLYQPLYDEINLLLKAAAPAAADPAAAAGARNAGN